MPAALPPDEAARLDALRAHRLLDTPPDPRVDAFIRVAAQLYDVPISAVSLVDEDRQWFKSAKGLHVSQTPRDVAFCAHAILKPGSVMVVEDATKDPRFVDNPMVTGAPEIRFYAGAPIVTASGHALGTLCIIDTKPRELDPPDRARLADLAQGVAAVIDLHRASVSLQRAATHDSLTGIANRALFEVRLADAVEGSLLGSVCALLCIDVDHFKAVNDRFGHAGGDVVLREAAARISRTIRGADIAARIGGDEFAVLLAGPFPPHAPQNFAERLLVALAAPIEVAGQIVKMSASIGIAVGPADGLDGTSLMRAADVALYRAKDEGRGRIALAADTHPNPAALRPRSMEDDLRAAISDDGFSLVWQPYLDLASGRTIGQEALLRWDRPGHGPMSPTVFIPAAEACGLIAAIDSWVLHQACAQAATWPVPQDVSVNMSPHWFCLGDLTELVGGALAKSGLDPSRLVVEITERTMINHPEIARERIAELQDLGVRVALDDFGTGYSSLGCLESFMFSEIKLDRSFINDLGRNPRAEAVARAIIGLGRSLEVTICAEGVESEAQLAFLRREGCDIVQGFLLGRPLPVPAFGLVES